VTDSNMATTVLLLNDNLPTKLTFCCRCLPRHIEPIRIRGQWLHKPKWNTTVTFQRRIRLATQFAHRYRN